MTLLVPESTTGFGTFTSLPSGVGCGTWNSDCVDTGGLSLVFLAKQSAWCMPSSTPFWPLVRLGTWLLISFVHGYGVLQGSHGLTFTKISESVCVETVFQPGWYHFWRGEMVTCCVRSPCIVSTVWDLLGPFYNSSSTEDDAVPLSLEARDFELEQSVFSDTFLGCDPVVGAGTAIVTAHGLWMSRFLLW